MELITRTARLVPYAKRPKQVPSYVSAISFSPEVDDQSAVLGTMFMVAEVLLPGRPGEEVASLITSTFQQTYYASEPNLSASSSELFEAAIKATNTALAEYVNQGNAAWIGKLSAIIGVQAGNQLHLSGVGSSEGYLYRHQVPTAVVKSQADRPQSPSKTFAAIASGQLEAGDRLLLATPALIHQLSLVRLHQIIGENGPNAALAEITQLLVDADTTRIAALIVESTTPEQAALQVRSDQPSEVTIGAPETPLEAAKIMAAPLAKATLTGGRDASKLALGRARQAVPTARKLGRGARGIVGAAVGGSNIPRRIGLVLISILLVAAVGIGWHTYTTAANQRLLDAYSSAFKAYESAGKAPNPSDKRNNLLLAQKRTATLATTSTTKRLDPLLQASKGPNDAPRTVSALQDLINNSLNELDGLKTVTAATYLSYDTVKNFDPNLMATTATSLYLADTKTSSIYVVNKSTKSINKLAGFGQNTGQITALTASATGDGIYVLTDKPTVWFIRTSDNSAVLQTLGLSSWEAGSSLAAYNGNLYLLSGNQIFKHLRTVNGFSSGVEYFPPNSGPSGMTALAVDGNVYVATAASLDQYLAGKLVVNVPAPSGLSGVTSLQPIANDQLLGYAPSAGRIGLWNTSKTLTFERQYSLAGVKDFNAAAYDANTGEVFVASGKKILSFKLVN